MLNNKNRISAGWLGCVVVLGGAMAVAQDWPQWCGANRDGKATFAAPKAWPRELAQKWKVAVGDGVATPVLVGDKLYVFSRQNNQEVLRCMEAGSGKELWQDKYDTMGASGPASGFAGPRSTPAVAEGKVVVLGVQGILSCYDAGSGKKLWRKEDLKGSVPRFCTSSSPIIVNGMCVAQLGGGSNGAVIAYDLGTGEQKWKVGTESPAYASLMLMTLGETKLIIAETEANIVAIQLADGKKVWETPFASRGPGAYNAGTPVVDGQTLIYSGAGRGTFAVRLEKEGNKVVGKELWKNNLTVQFNTPVVKGGMLYGLGAGNELFCMDMKTGQTTWSKPFSGGDAAAGGGGGGRGPGGRGGRGGGMGRGGYGSVVDVGSALAALTPGGQLVVYGAGETFVEQARIKVAGGGTYAYPVFSGNRLIVKDQDSVVLYTVE